MDEPVTAEGFDDGTPYFGWLDELYDALTGGKVDLRLNLRTEFADSDGGKTSQAYTSSLRLGYGTAEYHGFSAYLGFEDVRSADDDLYNAAGLNNENRRTVIADPEATKINQAYLNYFFEPAMTQIRAGRQRLNLDDARFVGNVGWRQNEQTLDGLLVRNTSIEGLEATYMYVYEVNRIFGDDRSAAVPSANLDFESDSHLFNVSYSGFDELGIEDLTVTAFAYVLDFSGGNATARANSSNTLGFRASGGIDLNDSIDVGGTFSLAHQVDGEDNPTGYRANYFLLEAEAGEENLGRAFIGIEVLGSYHGRAQFRTPLATAHKFNGWADAFLNNGGPKGLQDIYVGIAPRLPFEFQGKLVYHRFNSEDGGGNLGWEFDAELKRKIYKDVSGLVKYAYFDGQRNPDIYRLWFQLTLAF